jgi:hypothetical protein
MHDLCLGVSVLISNGKCRRLIDALRHLKSCFINSTPQENHQKNTSPHPSPVITKKQTANTHRKQLDIHPQQIIYSLLLDHAHCIDHINRRKLSPCPSLNCCGAAANKAMPVMAGLAGEEFRLQWWRTRCTTRRTWFLGRGASTTFTPSDDGPRQSRSSSCFKGTRRPAEMSILSYQSLLRN